MIMMTFGFLVFPDLYHCRLAVCLGSDWSELWYILVSGGLYIYLYIIRVIEGEDTDRERIRKRQ